MEMKRILPLSIICSLTVIVSTSNIRNDRQDINLSNDGGYTDILMAISERVPENPDIITNLKDYFTKASNVFLAATRNRMYFKNVTIVVPSNWSNDPSWLEPEMDETYDRARILVAEANAAYGNIPYTLQTSKECGQEGEYIHFTPEYLVDSNSDHLPFKPAKRIVREFSKLKWGLFDEDIPVSDTETPRYYIKDGLVRASSCAADSSSVAMDLNACPNEGRDHLTCDVRFTSINGNTSLLSADYLDEVTEFCTAETHNRDAINRQNTNCGNRSAWEVMDSLPDFKNLREYAENRFLNWIPEPIFRIVQHGYQINATNITTSTTASTTTLSTTTLWTSTLSDLNIKLQSLEFCEPQPVIQLTEFGQEILINSPGYPDHYVTNRNCTVSINVVLHTPRLVHIEQLATDCYIPYYIVGVKVEYRTCTQMTTGYLQSTDVPHNKYTATEFKLLLYAGGGDGFNLSVKVYPLQSMEPTDAIVDLITTPTMFITSHQGFPESFYSNNLYNKLTLTDIPSGYVVVIEFVYIRLGSYVTCKTGSSAGDVFMVSRVKEQLVIYKCGDTNTLSRLPPLVINATASSLLLEFITNGSQRFQGFLLQCTAVESEKHSSSTMPTTDSSSSYSSNSYSSSSYSSNYTSSTAANYSDAVKISVAAVGGVLVCVIIGVVVTLAVVHKRLSNRKKRAGENASTDLVEIGLDYDTVVGVDNSAVVDEAETAVTHDVAVAHRYNYIDLPEGDNSVSVDEYMSVNTISVLSSTEDVAEVTELDAILQLFEGKQLSPTIRSRIKRCKIPKDRLKLGKQIGKGNFGFVYKGYLITPSGCLKSVAIKSLKGDRDMSFDDFESFLSEGTLMIDFKHENVMSLLGVVFEIGEKPLVVLPYMEKGDLRSYVQQDNLDLLLGDILQFGFQISNGMEYLMEKKLVHRDLAARNCMVNDANIVKVADFGMSRDINEKDYYRLESMNKPLPIRWMAIESMRHGTFTVKTDVWSFGITIWELFVRGATPFDGLNNRQVVDQTCMGMRLARPETCPPVVYDMMISCWNEDSAHRPDFVAIGNFLQALLSGEAVPQAGSDNEFGFYYERNVTRDVPDDYYTVADNEDDDYITPF